MTAWVRGYMRVCVCVRVCAGVCVGVSVCVGVGVGVCEWCVLFVLCV